MRPIKEDLLTSSRRLTNCELWCCRLRPGIWMVQKALRIVGLVVSMPPDPKGLVLRRTNVHAKGEKGNLLFLHIFVLLGLGKDGAMLTIWGRTHFLNFIYSFKHSRNIFTDNWEMMPYPLSGHPSTLSSQYVKPTST